MKPILPIATLLGLALIGCSSGDKAAATSSSTTAAAPAGQEGAQEDPGEYGPGLNQVHVVRSLTVKISGGVTDSFSGKKEDEHTTLSGGCPPDRWANLGFDTGGLFGDQGGIAFTTNDPIRIGQTGEIDLDWVLVRTFKMNKGNPESKRFKSEGGTLTLTAHNPSKGSRRMTGTIVAKNLEPLDGLNSKPVDVEAAFDADFSCGVK